MLSQSIQLANETNQDIVLKSIYYCLLLFKPVDYQLVENITYCMFRSVMFENEDVVLRV
jgi:hypothetical protein